MSTATSLLHIKDQVFNGTDDIFYIHGHSSIRLITQNNTLGVPHIPDTPSLFVLGTYHSYPA